MVDCNLWEVIPHNFHLFCDKPPLWRPAGLKLIYVPSVGIELTIPLPLPPGCWTSRGESPPPARHWSFYLNFCNALMKLSIFSEFISSHLHITYPLWRNLYLSKTVNWMLHIFYTPLPPKMQPRILRLFLKIYSAWLLFLHPPPRTLEMGFEFCLLPRAINCLFQRNLRKGFECVCRGMGWQPLPHA